jgi:hypothetical protein
MDNDKKPITTTTTTTTTGGDIGELVHIVNNHIDPSINTTTLNSTRTHTSPLMGTSARAAKRRIDGDTGPIRIDGTDTYNQQLQHHYQNVRQILEDQQQNQITNIDQSNESRQSIITKQDSFEQRIKPSASTYDSPPREHQPAQKIITTITTTTKTTPTLHNQPNSSLNESSSSVGRLLEQAAELQKLTNINSTKNDSQQPLVIERTEQYQVFFDPKNHEIRRTPSIPITKSSHATDLDQAQVDRFIDDHQAIQQLTRVLQEHNTATVNEYKRFPSQSNSILINTTTTTTTTIPSNIVLVDRTNQPIKSEFTVIDALLDNPLGTNNNKQNNTIHNRFNDILANIRNPEYVNVLKQSTEKVTKKTKSKKKTNESAQTPLLNSKENKKRKKIKSKKLSKDKNYEVIDAIISSPVSIHLPDSYLTKYKVNPPLSQLTSIPSITAKDNNILLHQQLDAKAKNETVYDLVKIVNELMLHHTAVLTASLTTATNRLQQSVKPTYINQVHQRYLITNANQSSEPIKPRIVYRYLDERGNVLKISSTSPSELREMYPEQSQQNFYRNIEPTYFNSQQITVDNQRHHFIPEYQQRTTWQAESKLPTAITREDLELRDKRIPKLSERPLSTERAIPISIEREYTIKTPFQQQRISHHPNHQNFQLAVLPLSYQLDQPYISGDGTFGYDTDSTISEHSILHRPYDYAPIDTHYHNRPLFQNTYYQNHSPVRPYYSSPSRSPYGTGGIGPDYSGTTVSRNYIEVFRDGETKPSQVYSLPFNESISKSVRHSRYDQYQSKKSGKDHISSSSPHSKYERIIPSLSNHSPYSPHTIQHSPYHDQIHLDNYLHQSKSSDYRPLRTKLQREYKITPSLLVDEWDHPQQFTSTNYNKQTSISSPDDVFITNNQTNKA